MNNAVSNSTTLKIAKNDIVCSLFVELFELFAKAAATNEKFIVERLSFSLPHVLHLRRKFRLTNLGVMRTPSKNFDLLSY